MPLHFKTLATVLVTGLIASTRVALAGQNDTWTLTTADFKTITGSLSAIDAKAVTLLIDNQPNVVPFSSVVQLTRPITSDAVNGLVLCAIGGQRLVGTPQSMDQSLVWNTTGVGNITVPIEQTLGVLRDRTDLPDITSDRAEDTAKLLTGDTVRGIVTAVTDKAFTLTPAAGDPANVPIESIASLLFASPPGGRKIVPAAPFKVSTAGGSVLAFKNIAVQGDTLRGDLAVGGSAEINLGQIASIENTNGPVQWLSDRLPAESTFTPFFQGNFPPRMNRTVMGQPIRFGGKTYEKGIGVHSRTKLVYALRPGDKIFRTRYAIDGDLGQANVDVRILVDDKIVHEQKSFRAGALSPVIEIALTGAKTLTLEVDYGRAYDIQDRLNWIEPAVVRN